MNENDIWKQIIQLVEEERWDGEFNYETELVKDLRLEGDDASEFICLFSKKFSVNIDEFNFDDYFYPEGDWILPELINFILRRKERSKKRITLGDLARSVKEGKLV